METVQLTGRLQDALENDPMEKAWLGPNRPLFTKSEEHADMFLTTYRIRNAYERLLNKLEVGETVTDEVDMILVSRWFEMMFHPQLKMSLSAWKAGADPVVRIVRAYKDVRQKKHAKRPYEISLELSNGNTIQINPADVLNQYFEIRGQFLNLENSSL